MKVERHLQSEVERVLNYLQVDSDEGNVIELINNPRTNRGLYKDKDRLPSPVA